MPMVHVSMSQCPWYVCACHGVPMQYLLTSFRLSVKDTSYWQGNSWPKAHFCLRIVECYIWCVLSNIYNTCFSSKSALLPAVQHCIVLSVRARVHADVRTHTHTHSSGPLYAVVWPFCLQLIRLNSCLYARPCLFSAFHSWYCQLHAEASWTQLQG